AASRAARELVAAPPCENRRVRAAAGECGRGVTMGNAVVHFEIGGPDDAPLVAFYGHLFGWRLQPFAGGGYTLIDTNGGGGVNGGIGKSQTGEPWFTFYVEADDLQAVLDKAESLGGKTAMPVTDFGGAVTIAMFTDPDGLLVGLVKAADPSAGEQPGPSAGAGEPGDWFEGLGSDAGRTQRFYTDLSGWAVGGGGREGRGWRAGLRHGRCRRRARYPGRPRLQRRGSLGHDLRERPGRGADAGQGRISRRFPYLRPDGRGRPHADRGVPRPGRER